LKVGSKHLEIKLGGDLPHNQLTYDLIGIVIAVQSVFRLEMYYNDVFYF